MILKSSIQISKNHDTWKLIKPRKKLIELFNEHNGENARSSGNRSGSCADAYSFVFSFPRPNGFFPLRVRKPRVTSVDPRVFRHVDGNLHIFKKGKSHFFTIRYRISHQAPKKVNYAARSVLSNLYAPTFALSLNIFRNKYNVFPMHTRAHTID